MVSQLCQGVAAMFGHETNKQNPFIERVLIEGNVEQQINNDSNLFDGIENEPIRSLHELGPGLTSIFGETFMESVNKALNLSKNPLDRLTTDESAAICLYTMNTPLYSRLNGFLQDRNHKELKRLFPYLKLFFTAVFKLP